LYSYNSIPYSRATLIAFGELGLALM